MRFWKWLAGHWVYVLGSIIALIAVVMVFGGKLTPDAATGLALLALTAFAADFRPQLERHQAEMRQIFLVIAEAGKAAAAHNAPAVLADGVQAVEDGAAVASEVEKESAKS